MISNATFYFVPNGTVVPRNFNPGFVVLSFIISLVGAVTTLELLHRRTSGRGWYNGYVYVTLGLEGVNPTHGSDADQVF